MTTEKPKFNVIVPIESYEGKDTWLEVCGDRLHDDKMFAIVSVYEKGATIDFGYATRTEATHVAKGADPNTPIIQGD